MLLRQPRQDPPIQREVQVAGLGDPDGIRFGSGLGKGGPAGVDVEEGHSEAKEIGGTNLLR